MGIMNTILKKGHPALSTVCDEVSEGEDVSKLVFEMMMLMDIDKGIGLAANQIGITKRVFVVNVGGLRQAFINPVIIKRYGGEVQGREGCLSLPGKTVLMVRHKQIIVEAFDENWQPFKRKFKTLRAVCVQHEMDHLNGIMIGDER